VVLFHLPFGLAVVVVELADLDFLLWRLDCAARLEVQLLLLTVNIPKCFIGLIINISMLKSDINDANVSSLHNPYLRPKMLPSLPHPRSKTKTSKTTTLRLTQEEASPLAKQPRAARHKNSSLPHNALSEALATQRMPPATSTNFYQKRRQIRKEFFSAIKNQTVDPVYLGTSSNLALLIKKNGATSEGNSRLRVTQ